MQVVAFLRLRRLSATSDVSRGTCELSAEADTRSPRPKIVRASTYMRVACRWVLRDWSWAIMNATSIPMIGRRAAQM
jgi:hypothetical protein